jgi:hypothetical protein
VFFWGEMPVEMHFFHIYFSIARCEHVHISKSNEYLCVVHVSSLFGVRKCNLWWLLFLLLCFYAFPLRFSHCVCVLSTQNNDNNMFKCEITKCECALKVKMKGGNLRMMKGGWWRYDDGEIKTYRTDFIYFLLLRVCVCAFLWNTWHFFMWPFNKNLFAFFRGVMKQF